MLSDSATLQNAGAGEPPMPPSQPERLVYGPQELAALTEALGPVLERPMFTCWRWVWKAPKWTKVPTHPVGHPGLTAKEAWQLYAADPSIAGLGVRFGPVPGDESRVLWGADFDGEAEAGKPAPQAWQEAPTYRERSPSGGDKFHLLGFYSGEPLQAFHRGGHEIYTDGRYFTLTGQRLEGASATVEHIDPRPVYAAVGVADPKPYGQQSALTPSADTSEAVYSLTPKQISELRSALNAIPAEDRDTWINAGQALHCLGASGKEIWLTWSQYSLKKFDPVDAERNWRTFKPRVLDYRWVFAEAQRRGWVNPRSKEAEIEPPAAPRHAADDWLDFNSDELAEQPDPNWLIEGVVPERSIGAMVGAWSAGKSFLAADLCDAICSRPAFFGLHIDQTEGRRCLYVALESQYGWVKRNRAMRARGIGAAIHWLWPRTFNVRDAADRQRLVDFVHAKGPYTLIVLDTLAKATPGIVENANEDMNEAVVGMEDIRNRTSATVMALHHFGKDPSKGARGASALTAGLDFQIDVFRVGQTSTRYWTPKKTKEEDDSEVKHYFELEKVDLGLNDRGRPVSSCVVAPVGGSKKLPEPKGPNQKAVLTALRDAAREVSVANQRVGTWDEALLIGVASLDCEPGRKKERANLALRSLLDTGHLRQDEEGVIWLT